jgi:cytochrome c5
MSRTIFFSALIAATIPNVASAQTLTLKSDSINVPDRGTLFTGAGSDVVNNNCLACHSAGMVLNQPSLSEATWKAEAEKMIHVYGAPVDPKDVPAIVDYLTKVKSAP